VAEAFEERLASGGVRGSQVDYELSLSFGKGCTEPLALGIQYTSAINIEERLEDKRNVLYVQNGHFPQNQKPVCEPANGVTTGSDDRIVDNMVYMYTVSTQLSEHLESLDSFRDFLG
jgi:hypothetical protein